MISSIISRLVILVFGTLYPAYASYKAVRTKNLKEYVKWMMYWIVFALFTCTETITDVFFSWFPFYYEVKIVLVLWLLSPATKGSSILYRKFVHPALCRREQEIDEYIAKAKDQGYHTVLNLGTKGVNYATTVIMQTAIKGGGGLVQQLRKSYSLSDLSECEPRAVEATSDEADDVLTEPRLIRRQVAKSVYSTRRSASESNSRAPLYFPEVDVEMRGGRPTRDEHDFSHIKSSEDISSGYSSADNSVAQQLSRTGSMGARARTRNVRTAITAIKRPTPAEDSEVIIEEMADDDTFDYANMPSLLNLPSPLYLSQTNPPYIYQYVGDQVKIVQVLGSISMASNATSNDKYVEKNINCKGKSVSNDADDKNENESITENIAEHQCNIELNSDIPFQENYNNERGFKNETMLKVLSMKEKDPIKDLNKRIVIMNLQNDGINMNYERRMEDDYLDSTSFDTNSLTENSLAESDDEASYGTPDDSPKFRRKSPGTGKYGKRKAPSPPQLKTNMNLNATNIVKSNAKERVFVDGENLGDLINSLVDFTEIVSTYKSLQINPIAEKKRRHKSKSPGRIPKANNFAIGKLLQLPGKFSFWNKTTEMSKSDSLYTSSGDESQRSVTIDDFHRSVNVCSYSDVSLTTATHRMEEPDDLKDDVDNKSFSTEIINKSDVLKKLIEAKIENHPEYKYVSLHDEEIPTCSKSTEV